MWSPLHAVCGWLCFTVILFSSLVINLLQVLVYGQLYLSPKSRLALAQRLSNTWWDLFDFTVEGWSNIPLYISGQYFPEKECAILIGNHGPGADFITGICLANRASRVGTGRLVAFMKASLQWFPTVGWTHGLQGSIFLRRNWEKDQKPLAKKLAEFESGVFPRPFWIGLYPEGTRITPKKREQSQEFARKTNQPILNHVLFPRTKGFIFLIQGLPKSIDVLYDVTSVYKTGHLSIFDALIFGEFRCKAIHVFNERIPLENVPKESQALSKWLVDRFCLKDERMEYFEKNGRFPEKYIDEDVQGQKASRLWKLACLYLFWALVFLAIVWLGCLRCGHAQSAGFRWLMQILLVLVGYTFVRGSPIWVFRSSKFAALGLSQPKAYTYKCLTIEPQKKTEPVAQAPRMSSEPAIPEQTAAAAPQTRRAAKQPSPKQVQRKSSKPDAKLQWRPKEKRKESAAASGDVTVPPQSTEIRTAPTEQPASTVHMENTMSEKMDSLTELTAKLDAFLAEPSDESD